MWSMGTMVTTHRKRRVYTPLERNQQRDGHTAAGTVGSEAGAPTREARRSILEEKHQLH